MPTWFPVTGPRTIAAGDFEAAALANDDRDRQFYLKGGAAPDGSFVELAADAMAGDQTITLTELQDDLDAGVVLHFRSGPNNWARVTTAVEATDDEVEVIVDPLAQNLEEGDLAPWPQQEAVLIEAPIKISDGIGAGREFDKLKHLHNYSDETTLGTRWHHLGRKVAALTDSDHVDFIFALRNTAGSEQLLARIRFRRAGAANIASVQISTNTGAGFPSTPAITVLGTDRVGINQPTGANYTLDIDGDLDLTGDLIGIALWRESPPGTLRHNGSARVTGQLISTVATGTAPFTASTHSKTVRNLNVSTMQGHAGWLDAPTTDTGSTSVSAPDSDIPVVSVTASMTAMTLIEGECTVDVDAGDVDCNFVLTLKRGSEFLEAKAGALKLTTARKQRFTVLALVQLEVSDLIELTISSPDAASGSSTADGFLSLTPVGSPG